MLTAHGNIESHGKDNDYKQGKKMLVTAKAIIDVEGFDRKKVKVDLENE